MSFRESESFPKYLRLCSKEEIDELFNHGTRISGRSFSIIYRLTLTQKESPKVLVSVPKRNFKKAVQRNQLKRRIREALRRSAEFSGFGAVRFAIIYQAREVRSFNSLSEDLELILRELKSQLSTTTKAGFNEKN